jgi:IS30 family transposase
MGRKKELTQDEKSKILAYRDVGLSIRMIAGRIDRSKSCIGGFLKRPVQEMETRGRKKMLTDRDNRQIWRLASNSRIYSKQIKDSLELQCSSRTVLRSINLNPNIQYQKMCNFGSYKTTKIALGSCKRRCTRTL